MKLPLLILAISLLPIAANAARHCREWRCYHYHGGERICECVGGYEGYNGDYDDYRG